MSANSLIRELLNAFGGWNTTLIKSSFLSIDAETILGLPLPYRLHPDSQVCHFTKEGLYSVTSGYWLAEKMKIAMAILLLLPWLIGGSFYESFIFLRSLMFSYGRFIMMGYVL
ncbi:hypothetical protein ACOSP7_020858 [Xanthoceras sorbifolium]